VSESRFQTLPGDCAWGNTLPFPDPAKQVLGHTTRSRLRRYVLANRRINHPVAFLPLLLQPAFQFVTTVRGGAAAYEPFNNYEACCPSGRISRAAGNAAPSFPMRHQRQQRGIYRNR